MQPIGISFPPPDQLYAKQVKLLYKNAPFAYVTTVTNGAILAFVQSAYSSIFRLAASELS